MYTDSFTVWQEDKYSSAYISQTQQASLEFYSQLIAGYSLKKSLGASREV